MGVQFDEQEASIRIAVSFDNTRLAMFQLVAGGDVTSDAQALAEFSVLFEEELADSFDVAQISVGVNSGNCNNGALAADWAVALPFQVVSLPASGECVWE